VNERIKEFAQQAGFKVNWQHADVQAIKMAQYKEFAELIVLDCIKCIQLTTARDPQNTVQYKQSVGHIHRIREHFGVEE
jgi:hypothetical protein